MESEFLFVLPNNFHSGFLLNAVLAKDNCLWSSLESLDVQRADASVLSDKENILRIVADGVGFDFLNQAGGMRRFFPIGGMESNFNGSMSFTRFALRL